MVNENRVPAGSPEGGRWAAGSNAEPDGSVNLASTSGDDTLRNHPQFGDVADRMEMDLSADPVYGPRASEAGDRLEQMRLSNDSRRALTNALEALKADPEDEEACFALGRTLLRDADAEKADATALHESIDHSGEARSQVRKTLHDYIDHGEISDHTISVLQAGPRSDAPQDVRAHRTAVARFVARDAELSAIDTEQLSDFRASVVNADRPRPGVLRRDVDKALNEMDYGTARSLRYGMETHNEASTHAIRQQLIAQADLNADHRVRDEMTKRLVADAATVRRTDDMPDFDYADLKSVARNPDSATAVHRNRAAEAVLAGENTSNDSMNRALRSAIDMAASRTAYRRDGAKRKLGSLIARDATLSETERHQIETAINTHAYGDATREAINTALRPDATLEDRQCAVAALRMDTTTR